MNFLENLIEEQKRKRREKNIDIMKRISLGEKVDLSQEMSEAISNQENLFEESFTN